MTDGQTDRQTDGQTEAIEISPSLFLNKKCHSNTCVIKEICSRYAPDT